jgi:N-acetylmuramoyl-L-alanine amidase
MKMWIQGLLAAAVLLVSAHAESLAVTDVRFWSLGDVTRIAIEVNGEFSYSKDRLPNPERFFFDLKDVRLPATDKPNRSIRVDDGLVKQIRIGANGKMNTRIVLDLAAPDVEFVASQLSTPERLIIEVRRKGATPATAASEQVSIPADPPKLFQPPPERATTQLPEQWIDFAAPPAIGSKKGSVPKEPFRMARAKFPPRPLLTVAEDVVEAPPAKPAKNRESGNSMTRALGLKIRRVVIDPGHGGRDEGTAGPGGLKEKELVLDVSKRLAALVEQSTGAEVIFTRDDDRFIPLERRTQIANEHRADLFISIHANSSSMRIAGGVETYYLSFTTSKTAMEVAARENASSERSVFELKELLQKIALKDKVDESRDFASKVQASLFSLASRNAPVQRNRGIKKAPFIVLIGTQMPSVLAEIGFVSNPKEEALLKTPMHRQKIAEALLKGIEGYISTLSHFEVARKNE